MQQLEADIEKLEAEKAEIESALCSGTLSVDDLTEKSKRLPVLSEELDTKSMRWLELSEIEGEGRIIPLLFFLIYCIFFCPLSDTVRLII